MSRRTERVSEQIRGELAAVLRQEVTDPRLALVTLTRVDVAPDLGNAVVFWSVMEMGDASRGAETDAAEESDGVADAAEAFRSAAGFLRHQLAGRLSLKRMPELRFRHDPSLELGARTLRLLEAISDEEEA